MALHTVNSKERPLCLPSRGLESSYGDVTHPRVNSRARQGKTQSTVRWKGTDSGDYHAQKRKWSAQWEQFSHSLAPDLLHLSGCQYSDLYNGRAQPLIQQTCFEHWLYTRHYSCFWWYRVEQGNGPTPTDFIVLGEGRWKAVRWLDKYLTWPAVVRAPKKSKSR